MATYYALTGLVDEMIDPTLPRAEVAGPLQNLNGWLQAGLAAESDDPLQRGPVTRWIGYAFGNPRISRADALALLPLQPGEPNPLFQVCDAVKREGGDVKVGDNPLAMASVTGVTREEWLQIPYVQLLVLTGGDAIDFPCYFEIPDITAEVPATFPDRTYTELTDENDPESGVEKVHTWETWGAFEGDASKDLPQQIDGKWYRGNIHRQAGEYLPASAWVPPALQGAYTLHKTLPESE